MVFGMQPAMTWYGDESYCGRVDSNSCGSLLTAYASFVLQCFAVRIVYAVRYEWTWLFLCQMLPSVLWHCWLGVRKNIRPVKHWVMRCWHGYLPGARCRWFACGLDDATTTASSLGSLKSRLVEPFWCRLAQVVLEKRPLNGCLLTSSSLFWSLKVGRADRWLYLRWSVIIDSIIVVWEDI